MPAGVIVRRSGARWHLYLLLDGNVNGMIARGKRPEVVEVCLPRASTNHRTETVATSHANGWRKHFSARTTYRQCQAFART